MKLCEMVVLCSYSDSAVWFMEQARHLYWFTKQGKTGKETHILIFALFLEIVSSVLCPSWWWLMNYQLVC